METTQTSKFDIIPSEIWEYEKNAALIEGNFSFRQEDLINEFQELHVNDILKSEFLIITGNEQHSYNEVSKAIKTYNETERSSPLKLFEYNYFPKYNSGIFEYNFQKITCNQLKKEAFWNSIKITQLYENEKSTSTVSDYLDHLCSSIHQRNPYFYLEIERIIRSFFWMPTECINILKKYSDKLAPQPLKKKTLNPPLETNTSYLSFLFETFRLDSKCEKEPIYRKKLISLHEKMKTDKLIEENTTLENFLDVFKNKKIKKEDRIIWTGRNVDLKWFIMSLETNELIPNQKSEKWEIACKCFCKKNAKPFEPSQISKSSAIETNENNLIKEKIGKIVSKFLN